MSNISSQKFDFSDSELNSAEQLEFYNNWLKLKGSKRLPSRADFNPMDIPGALPFVMMENVIEKPRRFKIRLVGSKCEVPANCNGKYIDEFPKLEKIEVMLIKLVDIKKPYIFSHNLELKEGSFRLYSSVVVPFSSDGENVDIIMSCHCPL